MAITKYLTGYNSKYKKSKCSNQQLISISILVNYHINGKGPALGFIKHICNRIE